MVGIQAIQRPEKPIGPAAILALATANPSNVVEQSTFTDYYFRITNNEDNLALKEKFQRICKLILPADLNSKSMHDNNII